MMQVSLEVREMFKMVKIIPGICECALTPGFPAVIAFSLGIVGITDGDVGMKR